MSWFVGGLYFVQEHDDEFDVINDSTNTNDMGNVPTKMRIFMQTFSSVPYVSAKE